MVLMLFSGVVALVFGLFFLFSKGLCERPCQVCDRTLFVVDDKLDPFRMVIGVVMLLVGGWLMYLSLNNQVSFLMHMLWSLILGFGLLFVLVPHWLERLSKLGDQTVFKTDEFIIRSCKAVGVVLLVSSAYIFYSAFQSR